MATHTIQAEIGRRQREAIALRPGTVAAYVTERLGTRHWVVASKLTGKLRERGYDRAISNEAMDALAAELRASRPAVISARGAES